MRNKISLMAISVAAISFGCNQPHTQSHHSSSDSTASTTVEIRHVDDLTWEPLNPARGDQSPKAATLWGDRKGKGPTGFLVQFRNGFSSPPHIHNVSYRAVVISGLIFNDDEHAAKMWMPSGSFWTQPKGAAHITAAQGDVNVAYVEIEEGPYLVQPIEDAFDNGERPINVDASNLVWLDRSCTRWISSSTKPGPQIAYLWGTPGGGKLYGCFVRLPAGSRCKIDHQSKSFRAVVVKGTAKLQAVSPVTLTPGSGFSANVAASHQIACGPREDCILYIRARGELDIGEIR